MKILLLVHGALLLLKLWTQSGCGICGQIKRFPAVMPFIIQFVPKSSIFFSVKWKAEIPGFPSLDNYKLFKTENILEKYLHIIRDERHRKAFTRLRLHSHDLAIETGRRLRPKTPRPLRLCVYCNANQIEDEIHFLISCPLYQNLRNTLNQFIPGMTPENAFVFLLHSTTPNILRKTAEFIYLAFNLRSNTPRV